MTIVVELFGLLIGAYLTYKLEKIDKRQGKIEIDLEVIKFHLPKRETDK